MAARNPNDLSSDSDHEWDWKRHQTKIQAEENKVSDDSFFCKVPVCDSRRCFTSDQSFVAAMEELSGISLMASFDETFVDQQRQTDSFSFSKMTNDDISGAWNIVGASPEVHTEMSYAAASPISEKSPESFACSWDSGDCSRVLASDDDEKRSPSTNESPDDPMNLKSPGKLSFMESYLSSQEEEASLRDTNSTLALENMSQNAPSFQVHGETQQYPNENDQETEDMLVTGLQRVHLKETDTVLTSMRRRVEGAICQNSDDHEKHDDVMSMDSQEREEFINLCKFLFEDSLDKNNNNASETRPALNGKFIMPEEPKHDDENSCSTSGFYQLNPVVHRPLENESWAPVYPSISSCNEVEYNAFQSLAITYASSRESSYLETPRHDKNVESHELSELDDVLYLSLQDSPPSTRSQITAVLANPTRNSFVDMQNKQMSEKEQSLSIEYLGINANINAIEGPLGSEQQQLTLRTALGPGATCLHHQHKDEASDEDKTSGDKDRSSDGTNLVVKHFVTIENAVSLEPKLQLRRPRLKNKKRVRFAEADVSEDDTEDELEEVAKHLKSLPLGSSSKPWNVLDPLKLKSTFFNEPPPIRKAKKSANKDPGLKDKFQDLHEKIQDMVSKIVESFKTMPIEDDETQDNDISLEDVTLYPYQQYGVRWLQWKERTFPGGGILADEMGLGKTVMLIALIVKSKKEDCDDLENLPAQGKDLRNSNATLIICPLSCIHQWDEEIQKKGRGLLNTLVYHGAKKISSVRELTRLDVVLTTSQTLLTESTNGGLEVKSPLKRVYWRRIILDEAHTSRNPMSKTLNVICELEARHRIAVTGTPVHNHSGDFFSIVRFLRMEPFDDSKVWNQWIGSKRVKGAAAQQRLHILGQALMLRRTKEEVMDGRCESFPAIPPKNVQIVEVKLLDAERQVYEHLLQFCRNKFSDFMKSRKELVHELSSIADTTCEIEMAEKTAEMDAVMPNILRYSQALSLLLRLRQCAVSPHLIYAILSEDGEDEVDEMLDWDNEFKGHSVLSKKNSVFDPSYKSSKFRKILADLQELRDIAEAESRPMDKVVVVSSWTKVLELLYKHLRASHFSCVFITGKETTTQRSINQKKFNEKPNRYFILLLSLTAGGLGLNLVGGNHIFFLEPHWNPQMELQAQDRLHRFGQTKNVHVRKYISKDTVEDRILEIQDAKQDLVECVLDGAKITKDSLLSLHELQRFFK